MALPETLYGLGVDTFWNPTLVALFFFYIFFFFFSSASGFQTGIKRKREEEDDGDLNIDGDDSEEYGKPQYPEKLVFLLVKLVYLFQAGFLYVTSLLKTDKKNKCFKLLENPKISTGLVFV